MTRHDEAIFEAAVQLRDPDERAAYLHRACGENRSLRAEVEALLAGYARGDFLEVPVVVGGADSTAAQKFPSADDSGFVVGETGVGPYTLREPIGEGGMGLVFVAEQKRPIRRKVALKLIKPGMDSKQVVARFEAERQALALMDHPHIAKVLDAGTTADGRPFFVMELVKGVPITDHCDAHRLSVRERLALFRQVCKAVQHAHQKGVIHRDLKPTNILVEIHDVAPVVKVIDFGIAKALGQSLTEKTVYTGVAQLVGTPLYMSPEQAGQSSLDVDTRTDVYALGVLLYQLLTGTTPIDPDTARTVDLVEIRRIIREDEPARPSARLSTLGAENLSTLAGSRSTEARRLVRDVRGELDWVAMKCLEKDRTRRYESVGALAADVERYLANEPVLACPPSAGYQLRKFVRRNRARVAAAVVVLGVVTLAAPVVVWQATEAATARARADDQERTARQRREETEQLVAHTLGSEVAANRQAGNWLRAEEGLKRGLALLESVGGNEELKNAIREHLRDVRMAATLRNLSLVQAAVTGDAIDRSRGMEDYRRAFREFGVDVEALPAEEAGRLLRARTIPAELAAALLDWAVIHAQVNPADEAAPLERHLVSVAQAVDPDPERVKVREAVAVRDLDAMVELAAPGRASALPPATLSQLGATLRDLGRPDEAVAVLTRGQQKHPADFWLNIELGRTLTASSSPQYKLAIGYFRAALALAPDTGMVHFLLGDALFFTGEVEEAVVAYGRAAELNPHHLGALVNLGNAHLGCGRPDEAMAAYTRAARVDPTDPQPWYNLGNALRSAGRLEEAVTEYRHALRLKDNYTPARCNLGIALTDLGKLDDAVAELRGGLRRDKRSADLWSVLGVAQFKQDKLDEAVASLREAVRLNRKFGEARRNLGVALYHRSRPDEAVTQLREAIRLGEAEAVVHQYLGMALANVGKYDDAVVAYRKAVRLDPSDLTVHKNLGHALLKKGDAAASRAAYREAVRLAEKRLADLRAERPTDPDKVLKAEGSLAGAFQGAEEHDKADILFRQVVDTTTKRNGEGSVEVADALDSQADNLLDAKKFAEAEAVARRSLKIREGKQPDGWETFRTTAAVGAALLGQKKPADAEPLLLKGYAGMKDRSAHLTPAGWEHLLETAKRLADLYEAGGKADLAKQWREKAAPPSARN